jgi:hypothetical protein
MTHEERIKSRQINAIHLTASRIWRALQFVGTAIGVLEVFQEQVQIHRLPPVEEILQFCQMLN